MSSVDKLQYCYDVWKTYTEDSWTLQTVRGYCIEFDYKPVQFKIPQEITFSEEEKKCVEFESI